MPLSRLMAIALLCVSSVLSGQSAASPRRQLFGGYSFFSNSFNAEPGSSQPLNGWDASFGFQPWHSLRFKLETYAYRGSNLGAPQHAIFIMGGGQYTWHFRRESFFGEALLGEAGMNRNWGPNQTIGYTASISTFAGGGLDTPLTRHFAFRVAGGYQYAYFNLGGPQIAIPYRLPGMPTNFARISSGLVWQF